MEDVKQVEIEAESAPNELKGFSKKFVKRSKDKRSEDQNVIDLLTFNRENKLVFGAKIAEKLFKAGEVTKIYTSSNPNELTLEKIQHYGSLVGVEIVALDLDNSELGQKLGKPFTISMVSVRI
jgi:ribosomal protein L30E